MVRSLYRWVACFCLALFVASGVNAFESPDLAVARSFAETGRLSMAVPPKPTSYVRGITGRYYTDHEIASDVVAAPVAVAAAAVSRATSWPFVRVFSVFMAFVAAAYFATTLVLLGRAARLAGVPDATAIAALALLTLASQYAVYAGSPPDVSLGAPLFAGCLLAWMRAERGHRWSWLVAGVLAGILPAVKLSHATLAPVLLALAVTSGRPRNALAVAAGLAPGVLVVLGWNYIRTGLWMGDPYPPGLYAFSLSRLGAGVLGTLVSPGKGLLAYTPVLAMLPLLFRPGGLGRRHARLMIFVLVPLGITMIRFAGTVPWGGAGGWGIRYYVPWLPLLLWLLVVDVATRATPMSRLVRAAGLALVAAGLVINVSALVTNFHYRQQLCGFGGWSLRAPNWCAVGALPGNLARVVGIPQPDIVAPGASAATVYVSNRLTFWWYGVRTAGVPPLASWGMAIALLAGAAGCWRLARRQEEAR